MHGDSDVEHCLRQANQHRAAAETATGVRHLLREWAQTLKAIAEYLPGSGGEFRAWCR
jgi:hypothetical protein